MVLLLYASTRKGNAKYAWRKEWVTDTASSATCTASKLVLLPILSHNVVRKLFVHIAILVIAQGLELEFISSKLKL